MSKKQIGLLAVLAILCLCVLISGGVAAYFMEFGKLVMRVA